MKDTFFNEYGTLITFEGIDGSGKSSAAKVLYDDLKKEAQVLLTREPGATDLGAHLREVLQKRKISVCDKAEYLLFAADRAQHMQQVVAPALKAGKIVISDRMADSSYAYQGYGRGIDPEMIKRVNAWAMMNREPDITIYLVIDYDRACKRLQKRDEPATVFEQERKAFFERVAQGFEDAFKERSSVIRVDASMAQGEVYKIVKESVYRYFDK